MKTMKAVLLCCLLSTAARADNYYVVIDGQTNIVSTYSTKLPSTINVSPDSPRLEVTSTEYVRALAKESLQSIYGAGLDAKIQSAKDNAYSVRQTPQWINFTNDLATANVTLDLYSITALTNSIAAVTDAKSKAALQDVKVCIKQAHDEAQAIHKEVKDLKTILGKYLQVEP
jgi:hypothetical protein